MENNIKLRMNGVAGFSTHPNFINEITQSLFLYDTVQIPCLSISLNLKKLQLEYKFKQGELTNYFDAITKLQNAKLVVDSDIYLRGCMVDKSIYSKEELKICNLFSGDDIAHLYFNGRTPRQIELDLIEELEARRDTILLSKVNVTEQYFPLINKRFAIKDIQNNISVDNEYGDAMVKEISSLFRSAPVDVSSLIIKNFPIPHPKTPIEHLLEFKSHKENKIRLFALRTWINKAYKCNEKEAIILNEIEELMENYKSALRQSQVKFSLGTLRSVISGLLSTPKIVIDGVFEIMEGRKEILKAESIIKGTELSYIIKAQKLFAPNLYY
jgi:hypothetical protein